MHTFPIVCYNALGFIAVKINVRVAVPLPPLRFLFREPLEEAVNEDVTWEIPIGRVLIPLTGEIPCCIPPGHLDGGHPVAVTEGGSAAKIARPQRSGIHRIFHVAKVPIPSSCENFGEQTLVSNRTGCPPVLRPTKKGKYL